jgi:hypothetical protein
LATIFFSCDDHRDSGDEPDLRAEVFTVFSEAVGFASRI